MHERTKPEMFANLISNTKITDRPSDYLRELLSTASKVTVGDKLVRHQSIQALLLTITPAAVVAAQILSLSELGTLAEEILPVIKTNLVHNASAIITHPGLTPPPHAIH